MQTTLPSLSAISPFDQPHSVAVSSSAILSQLDARLYTWGIRSTGVTRLGTGGAGMDRQMFVLVFLELDTLNQPKLSKYIIYIHIYMYVYIYIYMYTYIYTRELKTWKTTISFHAKIIA